MFNLVPRQPETKGAKKRDLEATKTNPHRKRADGTFNLVPRKSEIRGAKKRDLEATKTNPRQKRADATWKIMPKRSAIVTDNVDGSA